MTEQAITNDPLLNLLEELRNELDAIETKIASLNLDVNDEVEIEHSLNCAQSVTENIAVGLVALHHQSPKNRGYTHISEGLPANTTNKDVLYIGINNNGFVCVFETIEVKKNQNQTYYDCYYDLGDPLHQMSNLQWWKVLETPVKEFGR